ncbi:MAG TPA: SAM-dependent methyltransferase [Synergistales bacterium]|nr:SAM-dependent methyltransferase [Synergistales bacterium]HRV70612.1 SAM-dependent methyltransferase [Thermovirgaceae bacterium]
MNGYPMTPIGFVESPIKKPVPPDEFRGVKSRIRVLHRFLPALAGLEEELRLAIIFRFHLSWGYSMKVHPRGDLNRPIRGVFSTCSPRRPNGTGLSFVRLLGVEGLVLAVIGLDAVDGTPVLDIKPLRYLEDPAGPDETKERGNIS